MILLEFGSTGALEMSWCHASLGDGTQPLRAPRSPTEIAEQALVPVAAESGSTSAQSRKRRVKIRLKGVSSKCTRQAGRQLRGLCSGSKDFCRWGRGIRQKAEDVECFSLARTLRLSAGRNYHR